MPHAVEMSDATTANGYEHSSRIACGWQIIQESACACHFVGPRAASGFGDRGAQADQPSVVRPAEQPHPDAKDAVGPRERHR